MTKQEWIRAGEGRIEAFRLICKQLGKDHAVTKMLGSLAWGRHPWETGSHVTLENSIVLASALDGVYETINLWARDHDGKAQNTIIDIYRQYKNGMPQWAEKGA